MRPIYFHGAPSRLEKTIKPVKGLGSVQVHNLVEALDEGTNTQRSTALQLDRSGRRRARMAMEWQASYITFIWLPVEPNWWREKVGDPVPALIESFNIS